MHLYAASSSQIQECWYHRVTPTYSFMTTLHVSYKGQRSFVHTQLSQLQSFQYLGKAVTIWNTRRDCHAQSPNYLLWNYFYPQTLSWGPSIQNDKDNPQGFSQTATHHQQWAPVVLAWGSTNRSAFPQGHRNCYITGRTLTRTSPSLPTAYLRALKGFSQPSMFALNFSTVSFMVTANLTMAKPELKSC